MPSVSVTTTDKCPINLQVGNHVYTPSATRDVELSADELAQLKAFAAGAGKGMFGGDLAPVETSVEPAKVAPSKGAAK